MKLRDAAHQALEALEEYAKEITTTNRGYQAITALREALADTQDWNEIEALRASLREHMAEVHRLRAAGWHSYYALSEITSPLLVREITRIGTAMSGLRAALEPVTDCHEKEGDKLSLPSENKDLSEQSLNEIVAQLKAATADRESRINFTPTHMVFTGDTLDCLKKLADERNADTGKTSDHIADAGEMVATSQESRQVEPIGYANKKGLFRCADDADEAFKATAIPLYATPPKRKPLTDEEIKRIDDNTHFHESTDWYVRFARAIERAHGIGGEE